MCDSDCVSGSTHRPPTSCILDESSSSKESEPQAVTNESTELSDSAAGGMDLDGYFALLLKSTQAMQSISGSKQCRLKAKYLYGEFNSLLTKKINHLRVAGCSLWVLHPMIKGPASHVCLILKLAAASRACFVSFVIWAIKAKADEDVALANRGHRR